MSGEEFLDICDKAFSPLMGGVPIGKVAAIAQPLYARMGIRTGQNKSEVVSLPVGHAIVTTLCALARNSHSVNRVQQADDGCLIEAVLPSDMLSFAGRVDRHRAQTRRGKPGRSGHEHQRTVVRLGQESPLPGYSFRRTVALAARGVSGGMLS